MKRKMTATSLNHRLPYTFGNEIDYLKDLGSNLQPGNVVVMLGFGPGVMAMALLEGAGNTPFEFYAVDNYNFTGEAHLKAAGFEDRVHVIQDLSWDASEQFSYQSVDLLIVDACHEYECVIKDIQAWWGKVKRGGIVFFHDYLDQDGNLSGVHDAIELFRSLDWEELDCPGVSIVFRRIKWLP